ncbi:unnamed protein product [Penicillium nalgiovense]|nr:unnamed protein product [Penicillium nalgiovense]
MLRLITRYVLLCFVFPWFRSGICAWQREFLWYQLSLVRLYWGLEVRTQDCTGVIYYVGIIYGWYWTWDYNGQGLVSIRLFFSFASYYTITESIDRTLWVNHYFPFCFSPPRP